MYEEMNDFSFLISFIVPSRLLSHLASHINSPLASFEDQKITLFIHTDFLQSNLKV